MNGAPNRGEDKFDWDDEKAATNLEKHGIGFDEAQSVFGDKRALTVYDAEHSHNEDRFITIGVSRRGNLLVVVHTDLEDEIRLISARRATTAEVLKYVEQ